MPGILLIEPFFSGSHEQWCNGLKQHSSFDIDILSLPGNHWKWRMHGAAVDLAARLDQHDYDLFLVSDFLDLATFKGLYKGPEVPMAVYFHENQITYPWSESDKDVTLKRDQRYGWINYTSALAADKCFFNSQYHQHSFLSALPQFLDQFPDGVDRHTITEIKEKSEVLPLGMSLFEGRKKVGKVPVLLWNHRWEYDKGPDVFCRVLNQIRDLDWQLVLLGETFNHVPEVHSTIHREFGDRILHQGYADSGEYRLLVGSAHILPVTSNQDFFGGSVVEAIHAGVFPLLPNKLAYPEHVPEANLYEGESGLVNKLGEAILNFQDLPSLKKHVEKYDWKNCISNYDSALQNMLNISGSKIVH